ncbi:MAG: hypothetical protein OXI74_01310, partial [Rhodospirillaceae bacterium]|nr:hypothetical protein [Rhodospirillaceae bacterium]
MTLAQLPPEVEADRLLVRAEREMGQGDFMAAIGTLEKLLALHAEHDLDIPDAFWFEYAHVAHQSRHHVLTCPSSRAWIILV